MFFLIMSLSKEKKHKGFTPSDTKHLMGFTLIELLVVIAIISTITSMVLASSNDSRKKERDTSRVEHVAQVRRALELFFNDHKRYPNVADDGLNTNGEIIGSNGAFDALIQSYLPNPQNDPRWDTTLGDNPANYPTGNKHYYYGYDPVNADGECDPVIFIHKFETNTISSKFNTHDATGGSLDIANADFVFCPNPNRHLNN
jgi:prepilin-type N-terminal cleavage/methylation domain-containing protein